MKLYHGRKIDRRELQLGNLVLLYNLILHLFSGKLKSRWYGPFIAVRVFPHYAIEL